MVRIQGVSLAWLVGMAAAGAAITTVEARQSLGSFRWQLQPFCNVVTVTIAARGGVYAVDGSDDQCGATQRAPLVGTATPNPDGSIGLGLHLVTSPSGRGLDLAARITLDTLSGPWNDSAGHAGTFVFNGAGGGTPRPLPTVPVTALAPGSIGAAQINPAQVQGRITGTCPKGHALTFIEPDGRPHCTATTRVLDTVTTGISGLYPDLAFSTTGSLLVASYSSALGTLRLVECREPGCTSDWSARSIDSPGFSTGQTPSIAMGSDGRLVIAHQAQPTPSSSSLRISHCDDARCSTATSRTIPQAPGANGGRHPALAIGRDGLPIAASYHAAEERLNVVHCADPSCAGVTNMGPLDLGIVRPGAGAVAIATGSDGLPLLAYSYDALRAVRVAHCGDVRCSAGTIYTSVDVGQYENGPIALAIGADGLPLMAYRSSVGLRVTHCGDVSCTAGVMSTTVEPARPNAGVAPAVVIGRDGLPLIVHQTGQQGRLLVTHCADARCTAAATTDRGDAVGLDDNTLSVALGPDGLPAIASFNLSPAALRITRCGSVSCQ